MAEHPTGIVATPGTVTLLSGDIPDSTALWERDPAAMRTAHSRYDSVLAEAAQANGGYAYSRVGDAFQATFLSATQALQAAIDAQLLFFTEQWPPSIGDLQVRMAIHSGLTEEGHTGHTGPILHRVNALLSAAHGGQVLLSAASQELVRDHLSQLQPAGPPGVQLRDLGTHTLKDLSRPEHVFQLVVPGLPAHLAHFPPLHTLNSLPNNLPRQATPFVGREKQTRDLVSMLRRPDGNLVTLTGPAGTGKTRLSLQVGAQMLREYRDGVWFVELDTLSPDEYKLVVSSIAETLGVREVPGQAVIETLKEYLSDKEMLLVLDNFEQVTPAAPHIAALLKAAPHLKVLMTSRTPLRLYGEREYHVPPLSLPAHKQQGSSDKHVSPNDQATLVAEYGRYEAVRLFVERAQAAKADFQMTGDNAATIGEICTRLDGLPLAIELAAARVRLFAPQALLGRLTGRLKILTGGAADRTARQQTLRGAIDWSYDLLDEGEKQLFCRMAVFNGGRTLEALEAVCNSEALQVQGEVQIDVLDGVQSLLDKSLVVEREGSNGEARYWVLETIHEYAREKLEESGENEEMREQHAIYFTGVAEEAETKLKGSEQAAWYRRLEDEHDNLRAALGWALECNQLELALHLSELLGRFWHRRGHITEGRRWLEQVISLVEETGPSPALLLLYAKALYWAGVLAQEANDYSPAVARLEKALAIFRQLDDRDAASLALSALGWIATMEGDYVRGTAAIVESLALYESAEKDATREGATHADATHEGVTYESVNALYRLGATAVYVGDLDRAEALLAKALPLSRALGNEDVTAGVLNALGLVKHWSGEYEQAAPLYAQSLQLSRSLALPVHMGNVLLNMAEMALHQGDLGRARALFIESLEVFGEAAAKVDISESLVGLAMVAGTSGEAERAARLFGAAETLREATGAPLPVLAQVERERYVTEARSQIDAPGWQAGWQQGRAMSMEQAIKYALELAEHEADSTQHGTVELWQQQVGELDVQIDPARKALQVEAITGTEYFRELQARARALRSGSKL